jgi:hypothetical protein
MQNVNKPEKCNEVGTGIQDRYETNESNHWCYFERQAQEVIYSISSAYFTPGEGRQ